MPACPFCNIVSTREHNRIVTQNELAVVTLDAFPITDGHSLIIPKRHIASFFEVTAEERNALFYLLDEQKRQLDQVYRPNAYNVGINDGAAAGQTIPHLHIHLIPRYEEKGKDPRGGVRWIVPEKADYWSNH